MAKTTDWLLILGGFTAAGCSTPDVGFRNTVPVVGITSPEDGSVINFGDAIQFEGTVQDKQDDADTLQVVWESSIDGVIDDDPADATGYLMFNTSLLSGGEHVVTLTATDAAGESAVATVELLVNGGDGNTGTGDGEVPTVTLDNPVDGAVVLQSDPLTILGLIWDEDQDAGTLDAAIVSSRDGGLWEGSPDEFGRVELETTGLSVGVHTIRLDAIDSDDNRSSDQVQIEVVADARPAVIIEEPGDGDWFWNTDIIRFEGSATDDVDHPQDLLVRWSSSIDGIFSETMPNPTGATIIEASLSAGIHTVGLTAVDTDGNETTYNVTVEVRDPLDHDGDLDGSRRTRATATTRIRTLIPTPKRPATPGITTATVTSTRMTGTTSSSTTRSRPRRTSATSMTHGSSVRRSRGARASRCTPSTTRTGWSSTRVMTGWSTTLTSTCRWVPSRSRASTSWSCTSLTSSSVPVAVDTGSGRLSVQFEGDPFDGGEDNFAIRVYADNWPGGTCGDRFEIEIVDL